MRIVLLEFKLMSSYNLATGVKDQEARTCRTLINGTNKGRIRFSVEHRHSERWGCSEIAGNGVRSGERECNSDLEEQKEATTTTAN